MTVKLSISVPDDVAAYLQSRGNASAAVTDAVRRVLPEARRSRQRAGARAYAELLRGAGGCPRVDESNDIALRGARW
jgi:hypothetical protein